MQVIVFDFDNHEKGAEEIDFANSTKDWHKEVEALRLICEKKWNHSAGRTFKIRTRSTCVDIFQKAYSCFLSTQLRLPFVG